MPLYVRTILITGLPDRAEQAAVAHERHLAELRERGKLRAAGRFASGDGYLEIIDAKDRLEADEIARSSPLVEQGLGSWMLREWVELDWR
jgi:uncharacterized protein YciI